MMDSERQADRDVFAGGEGWVWHPAIRALGWVKDWMVWATFAAVLWEAVAIGLHPVAPVISFGSVVVRIGAVCAALAGSVIPLYLFHGWLRTVQWLWKNAVLWFSATAITTLTAIVVVIGGLYGWMVQWIFHWPWLLLHGLADSGQRYELPTVPIWMSLAILAAEIPVAFVLLKPIAPKHLRVWRLLGFKRALKGYGIMAILRLRQPRKDFFLQAPLVRDVPVLAIAAVLHDVIHPEFVSWAVPVLLVATSLGLGVDLLLPPTWVFLGRSHFDSFITFDVLRYSWPFGVTLLDRDNSEWHRYYYQHAGYLSRRGFVAASFMNNPRTPRVWSLRSRGALWESTVAHLMELAPIIVVDARAESYYIYDEVLWLAELEWIDKALILGSGEGIAAAVDAALDWAERDGVRLPPGAGAALAGRIVTEEQLYAAAWTVSGLQLVRNGAASLQISARGSDA
jgi:hypothetical protein